MIDGAGCIFGTKITAKITKKIENESKTVKEH